MMRAPWNLFCTMMSEYHYRRMQAWFRAGDIWEAREAETLGWRWHQRQWVRTRWPVNGGREKRESVA